MEEKIQPGLVSEIRKYGKFDVTGCFNCGSCTVICPLSNSASPFPRRSMRYAILGLKKSLRSDLEPWLCYYCGDCSTTCPRETEPGESMMTLRRYLTSLYDWTGLSAKYFTSITWKVVLFLTTSIIALLAIIFFRPPELKSFIYAGDWCARIVVITVILLVFLPCAFRMWWFTIFQNKGIKIPFHLYLTGLKELFLHAVTQKQILKCRAGDFWPWIRHWLVAVGYISTLTLVVFLGWFHTIDYPFYHPLKWMGYLSASCLAIFTFATLISRLKKQTQMHKFSQISDWVFLIWLFLIGVIVLAVHISMTLGFLSIATIMYALFLIILSPWAFFIVPFGKTTHLIYRPLAMYFQTIKEKALELYQQGTKPVSTSKPAGATTVKTTLFTNY